MLMSKMMLHVSYPEFLKELERSVSVNNFYIGLVKAPVFALIISLVGCYQGFLVSSSSDSVGRQTTNSVVQSIFLIVIADAIFSVLFSGMGV